MTDLVINDCSIHAQFPTAPSFIESLKRLLAIRQRILRSGRIVRCPRKLLDASISPGSPGISVRQALRAAGDKNLSSVVVTWLAQQGPFWDDDPIHGPDDWFEVRGSLVTETGIGEAAMAALRGLPRAVVSFEPSDWMYTPVSVDRVQDDAVRQTVLLHNYWALPALEQYLRDTRHPLNSWEALVQWAREECPRLVLTSDVIRWLDGHPFIPGAAERFQVLLSTLETLKGSFDKSGRLTAAGMDLYQNHFVGDKAWFTDSSDSEKSDFRSELTFPDPEGSGSRMLCTWHGKVKIGQMRMHFTYPIRHDCPLYIVYIGPKLTKR
ncbi:hypothetical protein WMF27_37535 [Sorangium sp. So ce281]|uniref:hypothetical protein n=1 Tax=unclassified Sorangium TaxID=2621164 RepID=UPI003F600EF3